MSDPKIPPEIPGWKNLKTTHLQDCRVFQVEQKHMQREPHPQLPDREADFYVVRSTDWVNVVALTAQDELVLIEQWRVGTEQLTLEIPGGMVDAGESPETAAKRELLEETGFSAESWQFLGSIDPNPATHTNRCHTYLALGATQTQTPTFDRNELCKLVLAPASEIPNLVKSGKITHALVVVALFYEQLRRQAGLPQSKDLR